MTGAFSGVGSTNQGGAGMTASRRALQAVRDLRAEVEALRGAHHSPIAIVGMDCRFPGAAGISDFWEMLCRSGDGISEVPAERWDAKRFFHPDPRTPGKIAGRWGGFLDGLDRFDPSFFGISPREAPHVDPRQRLMLEIAWGALEDAGIVPTALAGSATGVYIATLSNDYDFMLCRNYGRIGASTGTGTANSIIANRLSYFLDLHGPSLTLDTACSGSLVAIELACRSLRSGESSLAIAGGVSINLLPKGDVFFSAAGALSATGRCRTFDSGADGIVRSEGAGALVLKRISDAVEDGDRIYAVIRGGAINHDGTSNGIMAPNGEAQKRVLGEAFRNAGIVPGAVQYIEAHGTGTPLGDPIEISALAKVMGESRNGKPLVLGSLKTNVGHMEAAAGVAGVIKVALSMRHRAIPPNRNFGEWNPRIGDVPFKMEIPTEVRSWPPNGEPRIAGVSGFSFGGTNAHLVIEEAPEMPTPGSEDENRTFILPISAKSPEALEASIATYRGFLETGAGGSSLRDVCFTACTRRAHHQHRFAATAGRIEELPAAFEPTLTPASPVKKLVFVFSGQGSHWKQMCDGALGNEPAFRDALEACDRAFAALTGWSVIEECRSGARLDQTDVSQAAVFSMQVALAALWRSWGIEPDAIVGQSLGEAAAAYVAGALTLEAAAAVVHHRGRLMRTHSGQGKTAVIGLGEEDLRETISAWEGQIFVAGNSGPGTSVVSGRPQAVEAMVSSLNQQGIFAQAIAGVDVAFHSPYMEPLRADLERSLSAIDCSEAKIQMMSTVTARWMNGHRPDARYWGRNLREPFQLAGAIGALVDEGFDGFLEISPHSVMGGPIRQILAQRRADGLVLGSCQRDETDLRTMMSSLARLYTAGRDVNWPALYPKPALCVSLPPYQWRRERYWLDQIPGGSASAVGSAGLHPLLGAPVESALPGGQRLWERDVDLYSPHYLSGHKILGTVVFPGAGYIECAIAAVRDAHPDSPAAEVFGLRFHEALPLGESAKRVQTAFSPSGDGAYRFQFSARENSSAGWTRQASGRAAVAKADPRRISPTELRERCPEWIAGSEHYKAVASQGLDYADNFRAITQLWRTRGEAIAELELDAATAAEAGDYCVHPVLIDAALQVAAATLEPDGDSIYNRESYVPASVDRARFHTNPGSRALCVSRLRSGSPGDPELCCDIQLTDADGLVCFEIEGLRLTRVGAGQPGARGKVRDWLYELVWVEKARTESSEQASSGKWTVFADRGAFGAQLAQVLAARGIECSLVSPGDQVVESLAAGAGDGIVWLAGLDQDPDPCILPLRLIKALAESGRKSLPAIWIVTRETQAVRNSAPILTAAAQLWGLGKVAALEHPELRCGVVDLGSAAEGDAGQLADELLASDNDRQLAFRDGDRFVARLRQFAETPKPVPAVFRADASYLITGGLGGLGLALAKWMAERGARRFILAGRTPLPARAEWRTLADQHPSKAKLEAVMELERAGASVHMPAFDVAATGEVKAYLDEFQGEGWPPIRGVIHAAGVVEDQLILRLPETTFARVLRPKVGGALALHEATKELDLDFFVLFSSISSVLGQFGQAHYAAGNAFMDHLAHWRRGQGLPATSINWGPWAETGVYARLAATDKTGRSGVFPMLSDQALEAMERIHSLAPAQIAVVSADWSRMPPSPLLAEIAPANGAPVRSAEDEQAAAALLLELLLATPEERKRRLTEHLRTAAARILRLDPARLDVKEPLTSLGMDSIMVVELKTHIETAINLTVSMADLFTGSVAKLADQLAEKLTDDSQLEDLLTQVENMSPEELGAVLGEQN